MLFLYHLMHWQYQSRLGMHIILYLITPWQYQQKLRLGLLSYIISRLGSICQGVACYSLSYHALAVSTKAQAWNAILYLVTPWQYMLTFGILFYMLSRSLRLAPPSMSICVLCLQLLNYFQFCKKKLCCDTPWTSLSSGALLSRFACALLGVFGSIIVQLHFDDILRLSCGTCASMMSCGTCAWAASLQARAQLTPLDFNAASAAASLHH